MRVDDDDLVHVNQNEQKGRVADKQECSRSTSDDRPHSRSVCAIRVILCFQG
jgi:hypothetical protein